MCRHGMAGSVHSYHRSGICMFSLVRNCQLSSKEVVLFYSLTNSAWELLLFHILTSVWCPCSGFGPLEYVCSGMFRCCFDVHILMTCGVKHLFICLFGICISSLVRHLVRSLVYFLIRLLVLLMWSFKSSLCVCVCIYIYISTLGMYSLYICHICICMSSYTYI